MRAPWRRVEPRDEPERLVRARLTLIAAKTFGRPVPETLLLADALGFGVEAERVRDALRALELRREARRVEGGWLPRAQPVVYRAHIAWAERVAARR